MKRNYNIGLDIGTNSVGWAITDDDYNLLKVRGVNGWGVRLFSEGQTAKERRVFRGTRRRLRRRRQRIELLRDIMEEIVLEKDPAFFIRMDDSFLQLQDKKECLESRFSLFADKDYSDIQHYKRFPTIYHVRKYLMETDEKADPRLIYLAMHHIVKYRGNFLYENMGNFNLEGTLDADIADLLEQVGHVLDMESALDICEIRDILCNSSWNKKMKEDALCQSWKDLKNKKETGKHLAKLMVGSACDLSKLFSEEILGEGGKSISLCFEREDIETGDKLSSGNLKDEQIELIFAAKKVHGAVFVNKLLNGEKSLSVAMVKKYEKHHKDLEILKQLFHKYAKDKYNDFFVNTSDDKKNYANYIKSRYVSTGQKNKFHKEVTAAELYKEIQNILNSRIPAENESYQYCCHEMQQERFLLRINVKDNGAIPYQIHQYEFNKIIENQGRHYDVIKRNAINLDKIMKFHIPYYVGPLNHDKKNEFAWAIRKECGKATPIYPWTFEDCIDCDASAEKFILRMTNTCTYLPGEKVIPKNSLLYAKYEVLNELNKIRVVLEHGDTEGEHLSISQKQEIYEKVFQKHKRVTHRLLLDYLNSNGMFPAKVIKILGTQKEDSFASGLKAYCDFYQKIGVKYSLTSEKMVEDIVYWLTVFEDTKMVERKIKVSYSAELSDDQIKKICKLKYSGWSRLSQKLLCGIIIENRKRNLERMNIMDILWTTNENFMQIINDSSYGFDDKIRELMEQTYGQKSKKNITYETTVKKLDGSPALKKAVWQTLQIVEEIKKVMGGEPDRIFVEFARDEQKKQRTTSRKKMLEEAYKKIDYETKEYNQQLIKELRSYEKVDSDRLFLYFCQNGRSLYSQKKLDIDHLSEYEIDHIIPQSYKKDDSIDNRALVLRGENQMKGDMLLLSPDVNTESNRIWWRNLVKCGLMSQIKYNNLTRTTISKEQMRGFIHRQLVETRQITKHVAILLQQLYPSSKVVNLKATLGSEFRKEFALYKIRELNDYHHAHDAYLISVIGEFLLKRYSGINDELMYSEFYNYVKGSARKYEIRKQLLANKNGLVISQMKSRQCDSDGVEYWNPELDMYKIRKILDYKLCNITRKVEETTGTFYNEMLCRKGKATVNLKKNLEKEVYGGYDSSKSAYCVLYIRRGKKKNEVKFLDIPIMVAIHIKTNLELESYVRSKDASMISVFSKVIKKGQYLQYDNCPAYFVSSGEISNARQLLLDHQMTEKLYYVLQNEKEAEIDESRSNKFANELFEHIIYRMSNEYPIYESLNKKLMTDQVRERFLSATLEEKRKVILNLMKITKAGSARGDLSIIGLSNDIGRIRKTLEYEKMKIVDFSITGFYKESR